MMCVKWAPSLDELIRYLVVKADGAGIATLRGMKALQAAPLLNFIVVATWTNPRSSKVF